ncbi:hypothetical protein K523DRAFT_350895 [Schizophyllum commune Tattone D]|nr:hypothetical protein K523DRAFT_350895 [Schizophyllum commune Tattone D]
MPPRGRAKGKRRHSITASLPPPPLFEPEMAGYVTATGATKRMMRSAPAHLPSLKRQALSSAQEGCISSAARIRADFSPHFLDGPAAKSSVAASGSITNFRTTSGKGTTTSTTSAAPVKEAPSKPPSTQGLPPVGQYTQPRLDQRTLSALAKLVPYTKPLLVAEGKSMTCKIERIAATILSSGLSFPSQQRRAKTPTQAPDFRHLFPLVAKDPTLVKLCVFVFRRIIVLLNFADFRK